MSELTFWPHPGAIQVRRSFSSISSRQESSEHIIKSSKISSVTTEVTFRFLGGGGGASSEGQKFVVSVAVGTGIGEPSFWSACPGVQVY